MRDLLTFFTVSPAGRATLGEAFLRVSAAGVTASLLSGAVSPPAGHRHTDGLPDAGDALMVCGRAISAGVT